MRARLASYDIRLMTVNVATSVMARTTGLPPPGLSPSELASQQARLAANLIMIMPASLTLEVQPKGWTLIITAVWNALEALGALRDMPASTVQAWLLRRFQELLQDVSPLAGSDLLVKTANFFVGGPLLATSR